MKFSLVATPYNLRESAGWVWRNVFGPTRKNTCNIRSIPQSHTLNTTSRLNCRIVFVGDMMPMKEHMLSIGQSVKDFIKDADYLVGNFEGTITDSKSRGALVRFDEKHNRGVIDILSGLSSPERIFLSVANNHSGDFGEEEFFKSVRMLEAGRFKVFGWDEKPYIETGGGIRMIGGTAWSNRRFSRVSDMDSTGKNIRPGAFNILLPHFGYELELYPRPEIVILAKGLIQKFDAIVASHPHTPQPVASETTDGFNKLIAYSLGTFFGASSSWKYQYGIILKAEVGNDESAGMLFGKIEWRNTRCEPLPGGGFLVRMN